MGPTPSRMCGASSEVILLGAGGMRPTDLRGSGAVIIYAQWSRRVRRHLSPGGPLPNRRVAVKACRGSRDRRRLGRTSLLSVSAGIFEQEPGSVELFRLWVDRAARSSAVAGRLVDTAATLAAVDGAKQFYRTGAENGPGIGFATGFGFRISSHLRPRHQRRPRAGGHRDRPRPAPRGRPSHNSECHRWPTSPLSRLGARNCVRQLEHSHPGPVS